MQALLRQCAAGTRVALVGGDGTLQNALAALVESRLELGVVPLGSGNDLARALGVSRLAWPEALELALRGRASGVDLGSAQALGTTHWFASSLTAGFDSAVGRRASIAPAWLPGRPKYLLATLAEIRNLRHWTLAVSADGLPVFRGPALFASVLNTPTYGSGLPAVPTARIDDHRLDLLVAGRFARVGVLAMLPRLMLGRHLGDARVSTRTATTITLTSESGPIPLAVDGEWLGEADAVQVDVHAAALGLVRSLSPGR
jgi:diacylglycerol kinase family enzyme